MFIGFCLVFLLLFLSKLTFFFSLKINYKVHKLTVLGVFFTIITKISKKKLKYLYYLNRPYLKKLFGKKRGLSWVC